MKEIGEGTEYDKKQREKEIEHQKGIIAKLKDFLFQLEH